MTIEIREYEGEVDEVFASDVRVHVEDLGGVVMLNLFSDDNTEVYHVNLCAAGPLDRVARRIHRFGDRWPVVCDRLRLDDIAGWMEDLTTIGIVEMERHGCAVSTNPLDECGIAEDVEPGGAGMSTRSETVKWERVLDLVRGCHDYNGGHFGEMGEAFHHGIDTVLNVMNAASYASYGHHDRQIAMVEAIGKQDRRETVCPVRLHDCDPDCEVWASGDHTCREKQR